MTTVLIFTPALIVKESHVEMVRLQSRLRDELRREWSGSNVDVYSSLILDGISEEFELDVLELNFNQIVWEHEVAAYGGTNSCRGVRRPTNYCIDRVARRMLSTLSPDLYLLRIIQDVFITDIATFASDLLSSLSRGGDFLAGRQIKDDPIKQPDHLGWIGHRRDGKITYVQGEVMFAPFHVWERRYLRLPQTITHREDDSLMSEWLSQTGGHLVELQTTWIHRHGANVQDLRSMSLLEQ